jgi:hypothetical protein
LNDRADRAAPTAKPQEAETHHPAVGIRFSKWSVREGAGNRKQTLAADLAGADLRQADLSEADLSGARVHGALHNNTTKWLAEFDPAEEGTVYRY